MATLGSGTAQPSLAFDQRHLLLAYATSSGGVLEVRSTADNSLVQSIDVGAVTRPP